MYQPRRIAEAASTEVDGAAAFVVPARRAARSRSDILRTRVAPTAVSVALLATSGAFALNLRAADEAVSAVPAPVREADTLSRDAARELVATEETADEAPAAVEEAPAEPAATEGDAAFVAGQWAAAFGAPAGTKFIQSDTVVRVQANGDSEKLGSVKEGDKISVTDKVEGNFRQVAFNGKVGWVLDARLGDKAPAKPEPKPAPKAKASKTSTASKSDSSAKYTGSTSYSGKTVLGLKPKAMVVYNAVTARWSFKAIGGYRATNNRSNHGSGGAIDFMTYSDSAKGWAVARYLAANAGAFDVDHIIFEQKIWTPY
ncbi:MAG: SH3 domain-containing protein, partial [Propioniciclava sp.]|nr:SH3 domain-containing protein [Propioniciclava sp.]